MKIIDIRGNLIKIESKEAIEVSSLLKICENNQEYLAQVLYSESTGLNKTLFAKVLSHFATPLVAADITNISTNATCEYTTTADLIPNFGKKSEVVIGELSNEPHLLTASKNFFDKKLVIVSELAKNAQLVTENFTHQIKNIGKTSIVFDIDGSFDGIKLTAGKDFKLPLNEHAIQFIYDKYFSDITEESKAQVSDIFKELKEYASTVPYIPFKTFKAVIDDVFNYSQNISLFFFKTKLDQLDRANVFANSNEDVMNWASLTEFGAGNLIINLSKISKIFISEYISLVLQELNKAQIKLYAFVKLEDSFADKDFLKELLESSSVCVSYITRPDFKFLTALKQNCASYIITGDVKKCDNFDYCKFLLKNLPCDKYILTGNYVSPVSLIFNLKEISEVVTKVENLPETIEQTVTPIEINTGVEEVVITPQSYAMPEMVDTSVDIQNNNLVSPYKENSVELQDEQPQNTYETIDEPQTIEEEEENNPIEDSEVTTQYEELPVEVSEETQPDIVDTISDYKPANIFSTEDEEDEEDNFNTNEEPNTVEYSTTETMEEVENKYEEIPTNPEEDSEPSVIEDYVPDTSITDNGTAEIEDYSQTLPQEITKEQEPQSFASSNDYTNELTEENFTFNPEEDSEEFSIIEEEEESIQEPEAYTDAMEKDLELEFSLDEPDAYEPIIDNAEDEEPSYNRYQDFSYDADKYEELDSSFSLEDDNIENEDIDNNEDENVYLDPNKTAEELLDEQIRRDVDKVYMAPPKEEEDEDLSEDDLDFIEELVGANDIVVEEDNDIDANDFLAMNNTNEQETVQDNDEPLMPIKNTATPAVPIYSAEIPKEAIVHSDPIQQGDRVIHVKFGIGVVEKIFSYGTKNFCSINFENIGRKVLDPNVTELKRA